VEAKLCQPRSPTHLPPHHLHLAPGLRRRPLCPRAPHPSDPVAVQQLAHRHPMRRQLRRHLGQQPRRLPAPWPPAARSAWPTPPGPRPHPFDPTDASPLPPGTATGKNAIDDTPRMAVVDAAATATPVWPRRPTDTRRPVRRRCRFRGRARRPRYRSTGANDVDQASERAVLTLAIDQTLAGTSAEPAVSWRPRATSRGTRRLPMTPAPPATNTRRPSPF
jgi:hypothetical protein